MIYGNIFYINIGVFDLRVILNRLFVIVFCFIVGTEIFAATTDEVKQNIINQAKTMGVEPAIVLSIPTQQQNIWGLIRIIWMRILKAE